MIKGVILTTENHTKDLLETFKFLLKDNVLTDVTLVCDDKTRFEAHRIVLIAGSNIFKDFLVNNPHNHPMIYLKGVKQIHLKSIIQFLYFGETTVTKNLVEEFLSTARELEVNGLREDFEENVKKEASEDNSQFPLVEAVEIQKNIKTRANKKLFTTPSQEGKLGIIDSEEKDDEATEEKNPSSDLSLAKNEPSYIVSVTGEKLYKYSRKMHKSSPAWMYGGYRMSEEGRLDKSVFVCGLCDREFTLLCHSPSVLIRHLRVVHQKILSRNPDVIVTHNEDQDDQDEPYILSHTGEKLYKPNKRGQNSGAWKYGGFRMRADGTLDKSLSICGSCGKEFKMSGGPSGLVSHLENKHNILILPTKPPKKEKHSIVVYNEVEEALYPCENCEFKGYNNEALMKHQKLVHPVTEQ